MKPGSEELALSSFSAPQNDRIDAASRQGCALDDHVTTYSDGSRPPVPIKCDGGVRCIGALISAETVKNSNTFRE